MTKFHPGVTSLMYLSSPTHALLDERRGSACGGNIGIHGENLTVLVLSLNRAALTCKLLSSISVMVPGFAGEALIVDNGSDDSELKILYEMLESLPYKARILELGENFGAAGGRNRGAIAAKTEWILSLDNDIYLKSNPLLSLQNDISILGCHFITMNLLNEDETTSAIRGGHLYLSQYENEVLIGAGSGIDGAVVAPEENGFLCTFMPGGACAYRRDTFLSLGGYDEAMFVGFEDIEFSVRIFRAGMKVGANDARAFVHNHPKPTTENDSTYEHKRFANDRLRASATHFEQKHGYRVWTESVAKWVEARRGDLLDNADEPASRAKQSMRKPQVSLVVDCYGWALDNISKRIVDHLSDEFDFETISMVDIDDDGMIAFMTRDMDLLHYLWRQPFHNALLGSNRVKQLLGSSYEDICVSPRPISFSIFDHLFMDEASLREREKTIFAKCAAYSVSSQKLLKAYSGIPAVRPPDSVITDGVDLKAFSPKNLGRFSSLASRPIRIGWVGNSAWGDGVFNDAKGYNSILQPVFEMLRSLDIAFDPHIIDRQREFRPHEEMPAFYSEIDVLLCTSLVEGTPNPVLEAMACGVPVVSTDVGVVSEAFGPLQRQMLVERNPKSFVAALSRLRNESGLPEQLSSENVVGIQHWSWATRVEGYRYLFRRVLSRSSQLMNGCV